MATNEEDMTMHEPAIRLLRHIAGFEASAINEGKRSMYWLILRLGLVGDVFDGDKIDLEWVQLLTVEV